MMLKKLARKTLSTFGYELRQVTNIASAPLEETIPPEWKFLLLHDIKTILDIGANAGQFAARIHCVFPSATIISFEPLREPFSRLESSLSEIAGSKAYQCALGEATGRATINVSEFSPSSSLLRMTARHKQEWPFTVRHTQEEISIARLDDFVGEIAVQPALLVKIDVQGYELNVIRGGAEMLKQAAVVLVEVGYHPLYEGQASFDDIYREMIALGFTFRGSCDQYRSPSDGRILFSDAIFESIKPRM